MNPEQRGQHLLARLDRLPVWPYSYWIIVVIGGGFFFAFFDIVTIGLALPVIAAQFHVSTELVVWAITSSLIGYIVGSFLDSRISDLWGRRLALMLSLLFFSVGSVCSALSPSLAWLIFWRFIIGMGIGAEIANVTTYMGELAPAACRGRYTSMAVAVGFIGFALVPLVGFAVIPMVSWGWRLLFAIGGLGAILVLFFRRGIPQSIRWYVHQGRLVEAEAALVVAENYVQHRWQKPLPAPDFSGQPISSSKVSHVKDLLRPPYLQKVLFFALVWFVYYIGNYGWLTLNTKLFLEAGYDLSNSLGLVSLSSLGFVLGSILAIMYGDRFERKYAIFVAASFWTLCLLVIAWWPYMWVIFSFGCLAAVTISFLIPLLYIYTGENFPTGCRATGISITDGFGHLGGAFCGQIILGVTAIFPAGHLGVAIAFTVMALTGAITAIFVLFGQRMTRKSLV